MKILATLLLLSAMIGTGSACGIVRGESGGTAKAEAGSGLVAALGHLKADANTRSWVEFGATGRVRDLLAGGAPPAGYAPLRYDAMDLAYLGDDSEPGPARALGLDPAAVGWAVSAGRKPVLLRMLGGGGVDADGIGDRLGALGATRSGTDGWTTWRLRPDNQVSFDDGLQKAVPRALAQFDVFGVGHDVVAHGATAAAVAEAATEDTLADDATFRAVADCLGDPLSARLSDRASASSTTSAGYVAGVGLRAPDAADGTEVICVSAGSSADATAQRLRTAFAGTSPTTGRAWNTILKDITVTVVGGAAHVVRVAATSASGRPVTLNGLLDNGDLAKMLQQ